MIKQFFPTERVYTDIKECISEEFICQKTIDPFAQEVIEFLDNLSSKLLSDTNSRTYPEAIAFAFWIRKSAIQLKVDKFQLPPSTLIVSRGLAFHIAPSNVDIMFLYSWVVSLLVGNLNIIRISQGESGLTSFVLTKIRDLIQNDKYAFVGYRNKILTYDKLIDINIYLSIICDIRVLWGGDQTVKSIKELPTQAHCKDISFSDKFSYSIINSHSYLEANAFEIEKLAENFFNDGFWFDQMGCSSPQIVFFIGNCEEGRKAFNMFKLLLDKRIASKKFTKQPETLMNQLVSWFEFASRSEKEVFQPITSTSSTFVEVLFSEISHEYKTCGGGFFLVCYLDSLNVLTEFNSRKDQTVGYFGFDSTELKEFIKAKGANAPCRVVRMGTVLDFDIIWDGYNLFSEFVKYIKVV